MRFSRLVLLPAVAVLLNSLALSGALTAQGTGSTGSSQESYVRAELARRGLTESEALAALRAEGIDVRAIPPMELPAYQNRILAILDRLAAQKTTSARAGATNVQADTGGAKKSGSDSLGGVSAASADVKRGLDSTLRPMLQQAGADEIYGHALFSDQSIEVFRTTAGSQAPESYVLDSGDQIRIIIFGASQEDFLLDVNSEGYIQPTGVPKIFLRGVTLGQARRLLRDRLASYFTFSPDQLSISIETARTMSVAVFGESKIRGSFSVSALNTAFNAMVAAGGPTAIGSVREIQVIRGTSQRRMDVYAFLSDPRTIATFDLQQNDVIFVPVAKKIVRLEGAIKRPMRYELLETEGLREAIGFAGGINFDTYPEFVQVERVEGDQVVLLEWKLSDVLAGSAVVPLRDGDVVRIRRIGRPLERYVTISGAVFYEGKFDLSANPGVRAVLERAQLRPQAKTDVIFIERVRTDETISIIPLAWDDSVRLGRDVLLQPKDRIVVFDRERYAAVATLTVQGSVRAPLDRSLAVGERLPLSQVVELAGGLLPTAAEFGYVFRSNPADPERVNHIRVNFARDGGFLLGAGDKLVVYDQRTFTDIGGLSVSGAVVQPVNTAFDSSLGIGDLLSMAGGLRRSAALNRLDVFRLRVDSRTGSRFERIQLEVDSTYRVLAPNSAFVLQPFDQIVVREIPNFELSRSVQLSGQVKYPGTYALDTRTVHLSELLDEAGGLTEAADAQFATLFRTVGNIGPIGIDLRRVLANRRSTEADPILLEGDVITIRQRENTIQIRLRATRVGELASSGAAADASASEDETLSFIHQGTRSARWYLEQFAGGFAAKADKWSVTVTDPTGRVTGVKRRALFFRDYPDVVPGSVIALRYQQEKLVGDDKKSIDWDAVIARTFQQVSLLLSLIVLSRQL